MDYVYEDGQQVKSTRLPGYSGVSGLDAEQDDEDRKRDDLEMVGCCHCNHVSDADLNRCQTLQ